MSDSNRSQGRLHHISAERRESNAPASRTLSLNVNQRKNCKDNSNNSQCTSNDKSNNSDINNSTKDAHRRSVFERLSVESNKSQNYRLGNITLDQSIRSCQQISNSLPDHKIDIDKISKTNIDKTICADNKVLTLTILPDLSQLSHFATIAEHNAEDLRNGIFEVKFIDYIPNMSDILQQHGVILIESHVFFPSYFHALQSLKCMLSEKINEEHSLPFGKQLSNKRHSLDYEEPDYFKSPSFVKEGFDISCLSSGQHLNKIDISIEVNWLDAHSLGMDDSQHRALITSMKSKLALIQGPPGTGKIVVGLKIAEILLRNEHKWREQDNQGPMLLLSYTNHVLDQFLVEISKLFRNNDAADNVRLGSRSEIEILKKYNLTGKRKAYTYKNESFTTCRGKIRTHTTSESTGKHNVMALNVRTDLKIIIKEHENLQKVRREIQTGIVHQDWLRALRNKDSLILLLNIESITLQVVTTQKHYCKAIDEDFDFDLKYKKYRYDNRSRKYDEEDIQTSEKFPNMYLDMKNLKMVVSSGIIFTNENIKVKLLCTEGMLTKEANSVSNIWFINNAKRWQLYKYWVQQSLIPLNIKIQKCVERYQIAQELYVEKRQKADIIILKKARFIACTTTRAARDKEILKHVSASIFLIEEAAEIPEHHVVACLTSSCQQLIIIGDHQQLRPSYNDYQTARQHKIDISLFERLIRRHFPFKQLEHQHQMRPEISELLVSHIYQTLKNDTNVCEYENVKGIHCNIFLMSHSVFEDQEHDALSKSHKNKLEALFFCELYRYLRIQGYVSSEITVLSTYLDQVRLLRDCIRKVDAELSRKNSHIDVNYTGFSSQQSVRVTSVDNFQGEENEIILLSLVRSNVELLKARSELWNKIVKDAAKRKSIGNRLQLTCQTHKNSTYVSKPEDFKRITYGGCQKPCSVKRQCWHICLRKCHANDPDHEGQCPKKCHVVCKM
ncbi:unnamed protein product [Mytilus coruscus]|uniref:NFX1-type zinc finger-containing protein 1 n=1 Tax=Mytilus coruscus TaxID=42192 RepID=A0A6J8EGS3_MYTCO|nr:unnamed protein product [Mytilus coruscus]